MDQPASRTDQALLQGALGGDQSCWAELVERYHPLGLRYVRRHIDDPYLAQDIMQNLWLTVLGAVRRQMPDQFGAIFWTLLKRRLIDELRKKGRTREAATLDAPAATDEPGATALVELRAGEAPDPQEAVVQSEREQLLQRALDQLPDHYRVVIVARQLQGRSNRETAVLLVEQGLVTDDGNVEKRVENYYYRGLKELRRQLEALGFTGGGSAA